MTDRDLADRASLTLPAPETASTSVKRAAMTTPRRFRDLLALDDFERHAQRMLPHMIFQYIAGGVETGSAMAHSRAAYADYSFLPRALVDTSARSTATELFGKTYSAPFGLAPIGAAAFFAYRGDLVMAEAARNANIPMTLSASSLTTLEDVIAQNKDAWFQAYLPGDQGRIDRLVDRVARAGYQTLLVTADTPMLGNREHNIRSGYSMPIRITPRVAWQSITHPRWLTSVFLRTYLMHGAPHFENMDAERGPPMLSQNALRNTTARDKLCWTHLEAIRRRWKGNLVVKGLLTPADADRAQQCGVDAIVLSSHGGRQLDYAMAPLDVLPEIAARKGRMKIIVDSGIRRGTDVLKVLALGGDFVLLGRPFIFAAALGGTAGLLHAVKLLKDEIDRDMGLIGINRLSDLNQDFVRKISRRI
jgi:L-lactate dehydrogenase (cytochrome)